VKAVIFRFPTLSFFLLAYAFTWSIEVPLMLAERGLISWQIPHGVEGFAAFGPFVAALVCSYTLFGRQGVERLLRSCINWRVSRPWLCFVLLSPFAVLLIALLLTPATQEPGSTERISAFISSAAFLELIIFGSLFQGLGEEPGWRGFALPQLRERYGSLAATLLLFPVWLCWHLPAFLSRPEFNFGAWLGFSLGILSAAIWLTLIYDATRSVLMAILWHLLINLTRGIALAVSMSAFLMFGQVVAVFALLVVCYWLIKKPVPLSSEYLR
jgi:membrane protease YdiL (CAAX protease family)